ncbi:transposase [Microbispora sp. RL4-1S]|uniref:Transposase n=1 Tax=Microbispora oryzae TaxID=2806554 RepID=A0A940WN74_9ACTN|nr:transposase [Microbispora oryzae]MBP2706477.1 transposase [Microbispora oryzae]
MDRRWVGPGGVEIVPAWHGGHQVLRLMRDGLIVADCRSVDEVAAHVDLADLCEVITLPARAREARTAAR